MNPYLYIAALLLLAASCGAPVQQTKPEAEAVCLSDTSRKAASVYLTTDEQNNPVICWSETDSAGKKYLSLSFFDSASASFSSAIPVPMEQSASLHEEGMPRIAVKGDGSILAVYETAAPTKENQWAGALHFIQSFDKGRSWTLPRPVHADTTAGKSRSFAAITRLSNGEIGACWLDAALNESNSGRPVKFASTQGANGFRNEKLIDSLACECCRTAISSDDQGNINIVYRDILDHSIRDISVSTSANNGQSFSRPHSFSGDNWNIDGCPHNGPSVINAGSVTHATWFTGGPQKGVYYGALRNGTRVDKQLVSAQGRFIQLALLPNGSPVLAYNEQMQDGDQSYSKIVINKIADGKVFGSEVYSGTAMASYPVVCTFGANNIVVAWKQDGKVYYAVSNASSIQTEVQRPAIGATPLAAALPPVKQAHSKDPVCGMLLPIPAGDSTMFKGQVYRFCSGGCKDRFVAQPAAFVKG